MNFSRSPFAPKNLVSWDEQLRTDGVYCRESAGIVPAVLKAVPVTGAAFSGMTMDQSINVPLFFPTPIILLILILILICSVCVCVIQKVSDACVQTINRGFCIFSY